MTQDPLFSDDLLNAFVDNQLDAKERTLVMEAIRQDKGIADRIYQMRDDTDSFALAFRDPPLPPYNPYARASRPRLKKWLAAAAMVAMIITGGLIGQIIQNQSVTDPGTAFQEVAGIDPASVESDKILIHVSTMDAARVQAAINTTEKFLELNETKHRKLRLEVVANAAGLGLLRDNSPYAGQISKLAQRYDNVSFKACGIAMENARLREGHEITLLPEAEKIPAALEEILKRLKLGWLYVRA